MITDPDVTRAVRSWLDEDADRLPERVLDAVLEQVPSTPQRRPWWPPRRLIDMTSKFQLAAVVATVALVAVVGLQLLPAIGGLGGPAPTPLPTASPTSSPGPSSTPMALEPIMAGVTKPLAPGTYRVGSPFTVPFTIGLPGSGWTAVSLTEETPASAPTPGTSACSSRRPCSRIHARPETRSRRPAPRSSSRPCPR